MNDIHFEASREKWLRFFWLKTAAVRDGVKPAELLRVRHCYETWTPDGRPDSLAREEIFAVLKLDCRVLCTNSVSSLVLFYRKESLEKTLSGPEERSFLAQYGYSAGGMLEDFFVSLQGRCGTGNIPHEVGIFIGYPVKDVAGFIGRLPRTPVRNGNWQVFGDASESLFLMNLYRQAERIASDILDTCGNLQIFFDQISKGNPNNRSIANG